MNIMIIQDIPAIAAGACSALQLLDDEVDIEIAGSLDEALGRIVRGNQFDITIIDPNLPDATGTEAARVVRELCPNTAIVVITGDLSANLARKLVRQGVQEFVPNYDATPQRLLRAVQVALERKERENALTRTASVDILTGALNRRGFTSMLKTSLASVHRLGSNAALCTIDIDKFHTINDRYGHSTGNAILRECRRRLARYTRANDHVGRAGGDEFWVLLDDLPNEARLDEAADKLVTALAQPFRIDDQIIPVHTSMGIAIAPTEANTIDDWIRRSDDAMNSAKANGGGQWYLNPMGSRDTHVATRARA